MWEFRIALGPGPAAAFIFALCVVMCLSLGLNFARAGRPAAADSASPSSRSCSGVAEVINCEMIAVAVPAEGGTGGPPTKMLAALLSAFSYTHLTLPENTAVDHPRRASSSYKTLDYERAYVAEYILNQSLNTIYMTHR